MPYSDYSGSSLASSYGVVSSSQRPDKPLIVKCTFDRSMRRITFSSAQNCSFELLRTRVEQCFSLYASSFTVNYKDDDGEVTDITSDDDLTEAIQYFHLGDDIAPISSNASVYSGRSSGSSSSRKITLRVDRLKLAEVAEGIPGAGIDITAGGNKTPIKPGGGMAQWLKEQSAQMVQSVLGGVPTAPSTQAPSVVGHGQLTDQQSISLSSSDDHVMVDNHQAYQPEPADFEELPGSLELELELEQNKRGSYYYTYTGSVISQSLDDRNSGGLSRQPTASSSRSIPYHQRRAARASRMTEDVMEEEDGEIGTLEQESVIHGDEFLQYLPPSRSQDTLVGPNPAELTECSSCGVMLDTFRYVCATCGPRAPRGLADATASLPLDVDPTSKGKGRADTGPLSTSPRPPFPTPPGSSSTGSSAVGELPPFPMSPPYSPPQPLYDRAHSHGHLHSRSTQLSPHPPPPHNPYTPDRSPVSTPAHPPSSPSGGSIWSMIESGSVPLVKPHLNTSSPSISKPLPQIPGSLPTTHTYPPPPPPSHSPASSWSARNVFNRESPFADPPQLQPPPPPPPPQQLQLPQVQQLQQQPSPAPVLKHQTLPPRYKKDSNFVQTVWKLLELNTRRGVSQRIRLLPRSMDPLRV
ncbi:hypothetical protein FRC16_000420 [Serendipita sp. 398]|nr:hypothetical protein FRC16_000420 [Serendipita sp. 398]